MSSTFRLVMIGNSFVGKTALIMKYITKESLKTYDETVGAAFQTFSLPFDGKNTIFQVWDTAGQEKYRSLAPLYYRNADVAILVYDVTDQKSFDDLESWINDFQATAGTHSPIIIVGNKVDLEETTVIDVTTGQNYATNKGYQFFNTSALSNFNVEFMFQKAAEIAYNHSNESQQMNRRDFNNKENENRDKCC